MAEESWEEIDWRDLPEVVLKGDQVRWSFEVDGVKFEASAEVRSFSRSGWPISMEDETWGTPFIGHNTSDFADFRVFVHRGALAPPTAPLIFARQIDDEVLEGDGLMMMRHPDAGPWDLPDVYVGRVGGDTLRVVEPERITRYVEAKAVVA